MTILGIDPSSSCTGSAILRDGLLVDAWRILPEHRSDLPNDRIRTMAGELLRVVAEHHPDVIVIEDTSGHVGANRHHGRGAGLSTYGKSIGWIMAAMESTGIRTVAILENEWTAGRTKPARIRLIAATYAGYDFKHDPGGDVADAIGIAGWWQDQQCLHELAGRTGPTFPVWPPRPLRRRRPKPPALAVTP